MPLYEYECQDCKEKFVVLVRNLEDEESIVCSKCKSLRVTKLFSSFSTGSSGNKENIPPPGPCSCGGPVLTPICQVKF